MLLGTVLVLAHRFDPGYPGRGARARRHRLHLAVRGDGVRGRAPVVRHPPQAWLCLYAAGLSANSVFWRSSRAVVAGVVALLAAAVLHLGAVVYDAMDAMSAFVTLLLTVVAPWAAVLTVGYAFHPGGYDSEALRAFTTGGGGRYRYTGRVDPRAVTTVTAFAAGSAVGVLGVDTRCTPAR
ncbi:cytosine permease [Streptomyces sp. LMG1-1-1.1]|uniref:cytosine permease n=1 Tax=Streptomyces sp. LMG1-1-1.1 TaxID=3135245 RepID=UPI0034651F2F